MTNRELFEREKFSFAEVLEIFNKTRMNNFDLFLSLDVFRYKPGDIVVLELNDLTREYGYRHEAVFEIVAYDGGWTYKVKFLTPVKNHKIGSYDCYTAKFIDANTHLY